MKACQYQIVNNPKITVNYTFLKFDITIPTDVKISANKNLKVKMFSARRIAENIAAKIGSANLSIRRYDRSLRFKRIFQRQYATVEERQMYTNIIIAPKEKLVILPPRENPKTVRKTPPNRTVFFILLF